MWGFHSYFVGTRDQFCIWLNHMVEGFVGPGAKFSKLLDPHAVI